LEKKKVTLKDTVKIIDTPPIIRGRTDMTDVYIKEAESCSKKAREAFLLSLNTDGNNRNKALWEEKQNSIFAILFSVFSLEAHINRIGNDELEKEIWGELERMKLEQKWLVFPMLLNGKTYDIETKLFKNFRKVIGLRNYLVHFKDYEYKELVEHPCGTNVIGIYEHVNVKNAELSYNTAKEMIKELGNLLKK